MTKGDNIFLTAFINMLAYLIFFFSVTDMKIFCSIAFYSTIIAATPFYDGTDKRNNRSSLNNERTQSKTENRTQKRYDRHLWIFEFLVYVQYSEKWLIRRDVPI